LGQRKRILFLNNQGLGTVGGGVTLLRHLTTDLARDHQVCVASYDVPVTAGRLEEIRLPAPPPPGRLWRLAPMLRARHLRRVVPAALIAGADCVVVLDCTFAGVCRPRHGRPRHDRPRIVHLALSCTPAQERTGGADRLSIWQYARLEGALARAADRVIVSSHAQAAAMARECDLGGAVPSVIHPTLPASPAAPLGPPEQGAHCTILCAGRLVPGKHFDIALRLLAGLPALPWRLVIAGDGPERAPLQSLASTLGIAARVHFAGGVETIAPLLADAQLLLHPSRYESFGMVIFEAMCAGRAVLAAGGSANIGISEILNDPPGAVLFADFDQPATAADTLARLIADPALRAATATAARARAEALLASSYSAAFRRAAGLDPAPDHRQPPEAQREEDQGQEAQTWKEQT